MRARGALAGDGLVVVGAGDGVNDAGLVEILRAFDPRHVADKHAVPHDLGFKTSGPVGVPLGFAAARQRHADAELADAAAEQVSVDATVTKGVDHPASPEFVHARKVVFAPEESLNVRATVPERDRRYAVPPTGRVRWSAAQAGTLGYARDALLRRDLDLVGADIEAFTRPRASLNM